jgi:hypothetical protein
MGQINKYVYLKATHPAMLWSWSFPPEPGKPSRRVRPPPVQPADWTGQWLPGSRRRSTPAAHRK